MREIKFRAQSNDMMSHGTWIYGYYVDSPIPVVDLKENKITGERPGGYIITESDGESNLKKRWVFPNTLGQYTGLKDKNGREIYEGDILYDSYSDNRFEVYFDGGSFDVRGILEKDECYLNDVSSDSEVIGNIHDNPELLKQ